MYALIMAGGSGSRLWPVSRQDNPKQLHALISDQPMITETVERVLPLIRPEDVWVVTSRRYEDQVAGFLPAVPRRNIIAEPMPLGTTLAIGLGALKIARRDPKATLFVGWSDSYIGEPENFLESLRVGERAAQQMDGAIIGVNPTFPATGYGYIRMGPEITDLNPDRVFRIARFVEKPDLATARRFVSGWEYLWNPGIAVWRVDKLLALFERLRPQDYAAMMRVWEALDTPDEAAAVERELGPLEKIAIDYAIYEKADRLAVVPADLGWSDIGTWQTYKEVLPNNEGTNRVRGPHVCHDVDNCLVLGRDRLIAMLGVSNLVVVDAGDCLLIADRERSQDLKELVAKLREQGLERYL